MIWCTFLEAHFQGLFTNYWARFQGRQGRQHCPVAMAGYTAPLSKTGQLLPFNTLPSWPLTALEFATQAYTIAAFHHTIGQHFGSINPSCSIHFSPLDAQGLPRLCQTHIFRIIKPFYDFWVFWEILCAIQNSLHPRNKKPQKSWVCCQLETTLVLEIFIICLEEEPGSIGTGFMLRRGHSPGSEEPSHIHHEMDSLTPKVIVTEIKIQSIENPLPRQPWRGKAISKEKPKYV